MKVPNLLAEIYQTFMGGGGGGGCYIYAQTYLEHKGNFNYKTHQHIIKKYHTKHNITFCLMQSLLRITRL